MVVKLAWVDLETTGITPRRHGGNGEPWEIAFTTRDVHDLGAGLEARRASDADYAFHISVSLSGADAGAVAVGDYYGRCTVSHELPGTARALEATCAQLHLDSAAEVAAVTAELLAGRHLIGANVGSFDVQHLDAWLRAHGHCLAADYHYTDIGSLVRGAALARGVHVPWPLKIADAARLIGLDPGDYPVHTGLGDAHLARDIYDTLESGAATWAA